LQQHPSTMSIKRAFLFLLIPAFITTVLIALVSLILTWLLDICGARLNNAILTGWIPFFLAILGYLLVIHHRLKLFFSHKYDRNELFSLLAIVFMTLPAVGLQIGYNNYKFEVRHIKDLSEIDPTEKNVIWKYSDSIPAYTMTYLGDFQEYTSGKHPKTDYLSYAVVHFKKEDQWILISESEMVDNDKSDTEKSRVFNKVRLDCVNRVDSLIIGSQKTHYFVPLGISEDLDYAHKTLKDLAYKGKMPKQIFMLEDEHQSGLSTFSSYFILISIGLNVFFFFVFSLFAKKVNSFEVRMAETFDISFLALIVTSIQKAPVTSLLLGITLVFFLMEISNDPNIFTVKEIPYSLRWSVSNEIWKTHEWYRLLTYPFSNFGLLLRIFDVVLFTVCAYSIEKSVSSSGFLLLSFSAQIAGGLAASFFDASFNNGLTVFTIAYAAYYLFTGFQRSVGFSSWKYIGITLLVFGLFLGSVTEYLEYQKLISASIIGFVFGPLLKYKETV